MSIDIRSLQGKIKVNKKEIRKCAEFVLKAMDEDASELSLLFVDDSYIKKLNRKYRGVNSSTDVLAFPMREGKGFSRDSLILGDVVVSAETAKREAEKRNVSIQKEMRLYVVHGILHLLRYDDKNPGDRKRMKAKELELLEAM